MGGRGEESISLDPTILSVQPKFHLSPELTLAGQAQEDRKGALVPWVAVKVQLRVGAGTTLGQSFQEMLLACFPLSSEMEFKQTPPESGGPARPTTTHHERKQPSRAKGKRGDGRGRRTPWDSQGLEDKIVTAAC